MKDETAPSVLRISGRSGPIDATVAVPASKSVANRLLVCALLADGVSTLSGLPSGDDVSALVEAVAATGRCSTTNSTVEVKGGASSGTLLPDVVDCRLAGTTSRFLTAVAALSERPVTLDGGPRLRERPMRDLHDALLTLGAQVEPGGEPGHLPVTVSRGQLSGGAVAVSGEASSQFLSALMLIGPYLPGGLVIDIVGDLVSRPYVEMTASVMSTFGVTATFSDRTVRIPQGRYKPVDVAVEPDHSSAAFVVAAVLAAGGKISVPSLGAARLQGDEQMLDIAEAMGAKVERGDAARGIDDVTVSVAVDEEGRPTTRGIDVDMGTCSDLVPAVAVAALFARGTTRISGVGFIRNKESDRLGDLAAEIRRAGGSVRETHDGLVIEGSRLEPARFSTHDDHRLAMALALVSLAGVDVEIENPEVVTKSWPGYFASMSGVLGAHGTAQYSRSVNDDLARPTIVAFDVDHTLTVADSVVPFMIRIAGWRRFSGIVAANVVPILRLAMRRDRDGLKLFFSRRVFAGRNVDDVRAEGVAFAERVVTTKMRPDTAARLRQHQEAGHVVLLVSASFGDYLHAVGDLLEVDAVLCTELESDGETFTGALSGRNCRGEEKKARVSRWLAESGISGERIDFAYGDSDGDTQLLAMADVAVKVGRDDLSPLAPDQLDGQRERP